MTDSVWMEEDTKLFFPTHPYSTAPLTQPRPQRLTFCRSPLKIRVALGTKIALK